MTDLPHAPLPSTSAAAALPAGTLASRAWTPPPRQPLSGTKVFFIVLAAMIAGFIAVTFLLLVLLGAFGAAVAAGFADDTEVSGSILSIDLREGFDDDTASLPLFGDARPSIVEAVRALERAESDSDISGVFIRAGFAGLAPASAEELGDALEEFKLSGKFVVAHGQGFENTSLTSYAPLAAAEIWQQAGTSFAVSGMRTEREYLKGVFDLIDADPEFVQFYEYKTAADTYDETTMTDAAREATTALLNSIYDELVADSARMRDMEPTDFDALLRAAPYTAEAAQTSGLIDTVGYLEEAKDRARELAGDEDADFLSIADYAATNGKTSDPTIALISGQGAIISGASTPASPFGGTPTFGSDTISKAFDDAADNDKIEAIVFRVSSPGGSAAGSDQVLAAVKRAQAADIPVVVSMGQYAASGGYYVSASADHIVAMPTTITGSIGVVSGKVALEGAFDKVGYNMESVEVGGPYLGVYSADTAFTDYQREAFYNSAEEIYNRFTSIVAEGRDMDISDVREIAKGRVWTGEQALERGLVDELGGIEAAITKARELAEIDAGDDIRLRRYPRKLTPEEQFMQLLQVSADAKADLAAISAIIDAPEVQALLRARAAMDVRAGELKADVPEFK